MLIKPAQKQLEKFPLQINRNYMAKTKNLFKNWTIDCRRTIHKKLPKIIYSLTCSTTQIYVLKYSQNWTA